MLQKHRWRDERRVLNIAIKLHHYDNNMMMYLQEGWVGQWCMGRLVTSNWSAHLIVDPSRLLDYSRQGSRLLSYTGHRLLRSRAQHCDHFPPGDQAPALAWGQWKSALSDPSSLLFSHVLLFTLENVALSQAKRPVSMIVRRNETRAHKRS